MRQELQQTTHVLITRSQPAAHRLGVAIDKAGYRALVCPLIGIEAYRDPAADCVENQLCQFESVVVLSPHAVSHATSLLEAFAQIQQSNQKGKRKPQLLAIGTTTATALRELSLQVDFDASLETQNSEALLASPPLKNPGRKKILVLSGVGGRTLLVDTLRQRGARVYPLSVYRRRILAWSKDQAASLQYSAAVVLSSGEAVAAFQREWNKLRGAADITLVVPNDRIKLIAEQQGFTSIICSGGAGDDAVITSLERVLNERNK